VDSIRKYTVPVILAQIRDRDKENGHGIIIQDTPTNRPLGINDMISKQVEGNASITTSVAIPEIDAEIYGTWGAQDTAWTLDLDQSTMPGSLGAMFDPFWSAHNG
jgi:hypothetical protein